MLANLPISSPYQISTGLGCAFHPSAFIGRRRSVRLEWGHLLPSSPSSIPFPNLHYHFVRSLAPMQVVFPPQDQILPTMVRFISLSISYSLNILTAVVVTFVSSRLPEPATTTIKAPIATLPVLVRPVRSLTYRCAERRTSTPSPWSLTRTMPVRTGGGRAHWHANAPAKIVRDRENKRAR